MLLIRTTRIRSIEIMETYHDWLAHHGIKGMKWDKRNGPPYPLSDAQRSSSENRLNPTSRSAKLLQLNRARGKSNDSSKSVSSLTKDVPVGRKRKVQGIGSDVAKKEGLDYKKPVGNTNRPGSSLGGSGGSSSATGVKEEDVKGLSRDEVIDKLYNDNEKFIYTTVTDLIDEYGPYNDAMERNTRLVKSIKAKLSHKYGPTIANTIWWCYVTDEGEQ